MTYNEQASSLWVNAARGLSAYLSEFSFPRKVRICWCMDASSEVIQRFQLFSGNKLKPSFLAFRPAFKPTVAKQSQDSSFLCPKCTVFFCVYNYFEKGCREKVHERIPKGIVGGFEFHVRQRNFKEWHERPWTVCLRVLKESNKSGFDSYVLGTVYWSYPISPFGIHLHLFSDNLSRNSCNQLRE